MCYFCHHNKQNPCAPQHRSINCKDMRNLFSAYVIDSTIPNHFCRSCKRETHHFWHANNSFEKPWLRCSICK